MKIIDKILKEFDKKFIKIGEFGDKPVPPAIVRRFLKSSLEEVARGENRCKKCNAPFEDHHHKHITRKGVYHSNCYKLINRIATKE